MRDPEPFDLEFWALDDTISALARPQVVHVTRYLTEGVVTFMRCAMTALDELGWRQTLTLGRRADAAPDLERQIPCSVSLVELPDCERSKVDYARGLARVLHEFARQSGPLTVHLHAVDSGLIERVLMARLRGRAACFYTPYMPALLNPRRPIAHATSRLLERMVGWLPVAPVCRCTAVAHHLTASGRAAYVLEEPVEDCFLEVSPGAVPPPLVVSVGRPAGHNAPELFAQLALRFEIDEIPARFVWIGDGDAAHEARLRASGVQVLRRSSVREVAQALARASIYVQTSVWQGVAKALIRAMAVGLPCVAVDVPSHRDVIAHGGTGFLVRDLDDLDRHVRWLLDEPDVRGWVGAAARRAARGRYSRDRFRGALQRLYEQGEPGASASALLS